MDRREWRTAVNKPLRSNTFVCFPLITRINANPEGRFSTEENKENEVMNSERSAERNRRERRTGVESRSGCAHCGANERALAAGGTGASARLTGTSSAAGAPAAPVHRAEHLGSTEGREGHEVGPPHNSAGGVFSTRRLDSPGGARARGASAPQPRLRSSVSDLTCYVLRNCCGVGASSTDLQYLEVFLWR